MRSAVKMHEISSRAEELWNFLSLLSSHLRDLLPNNCWILHFFTLKIFTFSLHILSIWMCSICSMSRNIYKLLALRNAASQFVGPNMRHIYISWVALIDMDLRRILRMNRLQAHFTFFSVVPLKLLRVLFPSNNTNILSFSFSMPCSLDIEVFSYIKTHTRNIHVVIFL